MAARGNRTPLERRSLRPALGRLLVAVVAAACTSPAATIGPAPTSTASVSLAPTATVIPESTLPDEPVGLIALGHSGINSDNVLGGKNLSWATSDLPAVRSVYLRMVDALPETEGHVANTGLGGSKGAALRGQAEAALRIVPAPRLVLIYSFDNDIRCAQDETPYVADFGDALKTALDFVVAKTPHSEIFVIGGIGRPAGYAALFADRPDVRALLGGPGACDMFDPNGTLVPAKVERLTEIVELYEAEITRVCELYESCHTDEGALVTEWQDDIRDFLGDWGHFNARGNAKVAEIIWPKVVSILGLPG